MVNNEVQRHVLQLPNRIFRPNAAEGLMPQVLGVHQNLSWGKIKVHLLEFFINFIRFLIARMTHNLTSKIITEVFVLQT
jgi:hypothetical protein